MRKHIFIFIDQNEPQKGEQKELSVLQCFCQELQNGLPIDELMPQLVTKKIITINDKLSISQFSKNATERSKYFLDQYIIKQLLDGDSSAFYKFLEILEASSKCVLLAARIKQLLMDESLQDKICGM